jgi:hypothetical protein
MGAFVAEKYCFMEERLFGSLTMVLLMGDHSLILLASLSSLPADAWRSLTGEKNEAILKC